MLEAGATCAGRGDILDRATSNEEVPGMNSGEPADHGKNRPALVEHIREETIRDEADEARRIRRLQVMISMVSSVISQDPGLTVEEASELAAGAKRAALAMFPDKELAYDLLYKPRLQRIMRERFRLQ